MELILLRCFCKKRQGIKTNHLGKGKQGLEKKLNKLIGLSNKY